MIMKSAIVLGVLIASGYALAQPALSDPPPVPKNIYQSLESSKSHPAAEVHGSIESVDYASGSIQVRSPNGLQTIAVVPSTTIYKGGDYAALSDLRKGQTVDVTLVEIDGRLVAQSIRLK